MTGITLPFVSHGGFSLITSYAMLGMLMAFSHRNAGDKTARQQSAQSEVSSPLQPGGGPMTQPAKALHVESQAITDRGLNERRPLNEDSFLAIASVASLSSLMASVAPRPEKSLRRQPSKFLTKPSVIK